MIKVTKRSGGTDPSDAPTPVADVQLGYVATVALDGAGNLYYAEPNGHRVRRLGTDGIVRTIAGVQGVAGFAGDGGPATAARLNTPSDVAVDAAGRVYIADTGNHRIRVVETDGTIRTIAGDGVAQTSGDGGPSTQARVYGPKYFDIALRRIQAALDAPDMFVEAAKPAKQEALAL